MRRCPGCNLTLSLDAFARHPSRKNGVATYCRECFRRKHREHYRRRRDQRRAAITSWTRQRRADNARLVYEYLLTHPCVDCGECDPVVLEFDHVVGVKRSSVERLVESACSHRALRAEIAKCEVRCANCHRRRTARARGYTRHRLSESGRTVRERVRTPYYVQLAGASP